MIDRFGEPVFVGWPEHHIIWIEAAMSLPHVERIAAFQEIGELTGRGYASVYFKSRHILQQREAAKRRAVLVEMSRAHQPASGAARP